MKEWIFGLVCGFVGVALVLIFFGRWEARWTRPLTFECADSTYAYKKDGVNKTIEMCFYSDGTVQWRVKP